MESIGTQSLVHLALLFSCIGLLIRDQLWLRIFILFGTFSYISYYYWHPSEPLWDAILASAVIGAVNTMAIISIVCERLPISLSAEDRVLYGDFAHLSPGQFRRLMRNATRLTADADTAVLKPGIPTDKVYYLIEGGGSLSFGERQVEGVEGIFVGEAEFIDKTVPKVTVRIHAGSHYLQWSHADLRKLMAQSQAFENALM